MFVYYIFNKQKALTTGIRDGQKYYYVDSSTLNLDESQDMSEMALSMGLCNLIGINLQIVIE